MVQFLSVLIETIQTGKIDLVVFFNGSLESERMREWVASQLKARQNINQVCTPHFNLFLTLFHLVINLLNWIPL